MGHIVVKVSRFYLVSSVKFCKVWEIEVSCGIKSLRNISLLADKTPELKLKTVFIA